MRTDNRLDQRFVVQIIELAEPLQVRRMSLDEQQRGEILVQGLGRSMEKAVLAVSGLTPVTMETVAYTYTLVLSPSHCPQCASLVLSPRLWTVD